MSVSSIYRGIIETMHVGDSQHQDVTCMSDSKGNMDEEGSFAISRGGMQHDLRPIRLPHAITWCGGRTDQGCHGPVRTAIRHPVPSLEPLYGREV